MVRKILAALLLCAMMFVAPVPATALDSKTLVFEDNFNTLNQDVWSIRASKNTDYSKAAWSAVSVQGGRLRLRVVPLHNERFAIGHIGTRPNKNATGFQFTYGLVEARMRFQPYSGSHSALWAQSRIPYTVNRPELDVAEYSGVRNPDRKRPTNLWHNVFYRDDNLGPLLKSQDPTPDTRANRWSDDFHVYGMEWTALGYTFLVDGQVVSTALVGLSTEPKYLVLSHLVADYERAHFNYDNIRSYKLVVDWVRVWQ